MPTSPPESDSDPSASVSTHTSPSLPSASDAGPEPETTHIRGRSAAVDRRKGESDGRGCLPLPILVMLARENAPSDLGLKTSPTVRGVAPSETSAVGRASAFPVSGTASSTCGSAPSDGGGCSCSTVAFGRLGVFTSWRWALRAQRFADLGTAPMMVGPKPALLDVERVICGRAEGGGVRELRAWTLCARGVETRSAEGVRGRLIR